MAETAVKKKTSPLVFIGVGCFILLFLIGVGMTIFFKFFAKKAIETVIENKTGVDISDVEKGKMTFTDEKTGAKVDIGSNKVPDTFPKDFPIYPGAKVTSSLSGAEAGKNSGFWLTMTSPDSVEKITAFYKTEFAKNGWKTDSTFTADNTVTETVSKSGWSGSLAISRDQDSKETQIVIILGQDEK